MLPKSSPFRRPARGAGSPGQSPLSVFTASLLAGAGALLAFAGSPQRAQAQDVLAAAKPRPYQAWTQVPEYNVRYEVRFNKSFSQPWDWQGSVHDFDMNMRATAVGKIKFDSSNGRYWIYRGDLENRGDLCDG